MSNNFVREGNLSGDAVLDWVAQKVFFESVKIGTGSPSAAPSPASKVWLYADRSQNPAIMWLWDPSTATWHITGDGTGTGVVDSVNGQTGIVVLDHTDVGAEEAGAVADLAATLATVATSGDYDDLINKPTIPDISNLVEDTDPRLSDARTPTAHTHPQSDVTGLVSDLAAKVADTDPRLSDARTPLAHTHAATAVTSVPATTGLDPASTDVEKALTELAARPSGGGSAPITSPKVPAGRYLSPPINHMWSTPGGAYVWWVPVTVECPQAFNAIGLMVQSAGAGVTADFALVGDAGGYPGTVLRSSTDVPLTLAMGEAAKVGAFSAISLPVGLVWMAVRIADPHDDCQVASAANNGQQPWGIPYRHFMGLPPYPNVAVHNSYGGGYKSATILSSIPTTAPSGMFGLASGSPLPGLRAASW